MLLQDWLMFSVTSAAFLAVPGRTAKRIVDCKRAGGAKLAGLTLLGCITGYGLLTSVVFGALQSLVNAGAVVLEQLQWFGTAALMLLALRLWKAPLHIGPVADNDNMANKSFAAIVSQGVFSSAFNMRTLVFLLAIATQLGASFLPQHNDFLSFEGIFIGVASVTCLYQAIFSNAIDRIIRRRSVRKLTPQNGKTMLISARSVSAGFRKIAA
jgi:threonine/homoserine/homoserine lactone efflux protein